MRGGRRPGAGAPKYNPDAPRDHNREARTRTVTRALRAAVGTEAAFPFGTSSSAPTSSAQKASTGRTSPPSATSSSASCSR